MKETLHGDALLVGSRLLLQAAPETAQMPGEENHNTPLHTFLANKDLWRDFTVGLMSQWQLR